MTLAENKELVLFYKHQHTDEGNISEHYEKPRYAGTAQTNNFYFNTSNKHVLLERIDSEYKDAHDEYSEGMMRITTTIYEFAENVTLEHVVSFCCMQEQGVNEPLKFFNKLLEKSATIISNVTIE